MSKSAESDLSRINLLDDPKTIQNKIKRAKTDAADGLEWGNPDRPEATNLLGIYSLCTGMSMVWTLLAALLLPFVHVFDLGNDCSLHLISKYNSLSILSCYSCSRH